MTTKEQYRRRYLRLRDELDRLSEPYSCGQALAAFLNPRISELQRELDDLVAEIQHIPITTRKRMTQEEEDEMRTIPKEILDLIIRFLDYSFNDIGAEYAGLTDAERALCTQEQFMKLITWMNENRED